MAILIVPSCAQPTSFVINGGVFYEDGNPCDDPMVNITNLNTSAKWQAETNANSNHYQIINGTDLNATEILRFDVTGGTSTSVTDHTISVSEVNDGGIFDLNITLGPASVDADLIVESIDINPNCSSSGDAIFVNESNEIRATVCNAGSGDITGNFDVCFNDDANSAYIGSTTVTGGLAAGANTTVCINWIPSCMDYPAQAAYPASGIPATLNATVDCNGAITESDETNNTRLLTTNVSINGYKSKNFDCDVTDPLTPFKYAGDEFTGGLVYNVSGTKKYPFAPGENQTRVHHIDLPSGAKVLDARLYIVWYDYFYNPPPGCLANMSVDFTSPCGSATFTTPDAMYTDQKAFGSYNTPKGKYAYNVTSLVCDTESNNYSMTVENIDPANSTTLLGGILVVVYEGAQMRYSCGGRKAATCSVAGLSTVHPQPKQQRQ